MLFQFAGLGRKLRAESARRRRNRGTATEGSGVSGIENLEERVMLAADIQSALLNATPNTANAGGTVTVNWEAINQGDLNAEAFKVEFFLSDTATFGPGAPSLVDVDASALNANGGRTGVQQTSVTLPAQANDVYSLGDGQYFLIMFLDSRGTVVETTAGEENNFAVVPITVNNTGVARPDLRGTLTVPTPQDAGDTFTFQWQVSNAGTLDASSTFTVEFYLTTGTFVAPDSIQLPSEVVTGGVTAGGNTGQNSKTVTLPGPGQDFWRNGDGTYHVVMEIDVTSAIAESNEDNNQILADLVVNNTDAPLPDLLSSSLTGPTTVTAGGQATLQWVVQNNGPVAAGGFGVEFYLSSQNFLTPDAISLGTASVAGLGANAATTGTRTINVNVPGPSSIVYDGDGEYFFLMQIDDEMVVSESNEFNNSSSATTQVTGTNALAPSLDVDGDNQMNALSDGVLVLRYMAGFTGTALTANAVNNNGSRPTATSIIGFLDANNPAMLDVDGNGRVDTLTDGILIIRYMAGFTGTTLTNNAVDTTAGTRTDSAAIIAFLDSFRPTPPTGGATLPGAVVLTTHAVADDDAADDSTSNAAATVVIDTAADAPATSDSDDTNSARDTSHPAASGPLATSAPANNDDDLDSVFAELLSIQI